MPASRFFKFRNGRISPLFTIEEGPEKHIPLVLRRELSVNLGAYRSAQTLQSDSLKARSEPFP